ncbi:hypothetical protein [Blastopirellula marina]|nr:hypothetical protein [Blastopirellula marina]
MRRYGSYALIATYLVVQLFGQVIHAWSGCEHAHLPSLATQADVGWHGNSHDHAHGHRHHQHDATESRGPGWHAGHSHGVAADRCLICQHLALGQMASGTSDLVGEPLTVALLKVGTTRLATEKWLGPNSPRAPPVA